MSNIDASHTEDIPEVTYDSTRARHGALIPLPATKERITIRLDKDIVAWFKQRVHEQGGGNYQTLINDALRAHTQGQGTLETTLRRVLQEEFYPARHTPDTSEAARSPVASTRAEGKS